MVATNNNYPKNSPFKSSRLIETGETDRQSITGPPPMYYLWARTGPAANLSIFSEFQGTWYLETLAKQHSYKMNPLYESTESKLVGTSDDDNICTAEGNARDQISNAVIKDRNISVLETILD